jgi:hypothetical protein
MSKPRVTLFLRFCLDERAIQPSGPGGARIPVCRASTGRWTVSATDPFRGPTKRPGVFVTPGPRLRARDVRGRASRPQGIEPERARRLLGGSLRLLGTQDVTRTRGEHGRPRCKGCRRPTRLGTDLTARPVVSSYTSTDAAPREDVRATRGDSGSPVPVQERTASRTNGGRGS